MDAGRQRTMVMNKIIFLDVDGVLNCSSDWSGPHADSVSTLDPVKCDELARVVRETEATVVLSSTWRLPFAAKSRRKLVLWLKERDVIIHDFTPDLTIGVIGWGEARRPMRGDEIKHWLDANASDFPDPRIVIIDDDSDFLDEQMPFFVHTSFLDNPGGLTPELANKAIEILNKGQ